MNNGIGAYRITTPSGAHGSAGTQAEPFSFSIAPTIARTPAPKVTIQKVAGETATIAVEYWQQGSDAILPEVLARLKATFPEANITVGATEGV